MTPFDWSVIEEVSLKRMAVLVLLSILCVSVLTACEGGVTPTPRQPIILSIVPATPGLVGPNPVPSVPSDGQQAKPLPTFTPE